MSKKIIVFIVMLMVLLFSKQAQVLAASNFPSSWSNQKSAKSISGMITSASKGTTEYTFTPIKGGKKSLGEFSFSSFGNDSTCVAKKIIGGNSHDGKSLFSAFLKDYSATPVNYVDRIEFNVKNCPASYKGKIGARYNNIGFYNGKIIDMKMTIYNWSLSTLDSLNVKQNGIWLTKNFDVHGLNANSMSIRYSFFEAGSETPVKVKGYWTYSDIDALQSITINKAYIVGKQWVGSDSILYSATSNSNDSTYQHIYEKDNIGYQGSSTRADFSKSSWGHEYDTTNLTYTYRNNRLINSKNTTKSLIVFNYDSKSPLEPQPFALEKYLSTAGDITSTEINEVTKAIDSHQSKDNYKKVNALLSETEKQQKFNYHLVQTTPYLINAEQYWQGYYIKDKINQEFKILEDEIAIYSISANKLVNDYFDIDIAENNEVTIMAKDSSLKNSAFYGTNFIFKIPVYLKEDIELDDLAKYLVANEYGKYRFPNTATAFTTTNNGLVENKTQEVNIEAEVLPDPYLKKTTTEEGLNVNDIFEYTIELGNNEKAAVWRNIKLEDRLPDYLSYVANTTTIDNQQLSDEQASWSKDNNIDILKSEFTSLNANEKRIIKFKVKVIKIPQDSEQLLVKNKVLVNSDNYQPLEDEVKTPLLPKPLISKVNETRLYEKGDLIDYTIKVSNDKDAGKWLAVKLNDKLKEYLEYQSNTTLVTPIKIGAVQEAKKSFMKVTDEQDNDNVVWDNNHLMVDIGDLKQEEYVLITFKVKLLVDVNEVENIAYASGEAEGKSKVEIPGVDKPIIAKVSNPCIEIIKMSSAEDTVVSGAVFALYDNLENKQVAEWQSSQESKKIYVTDNNFYLKELKAPQGYHLGKKIYKLNKQKIVVKNKPIALPKTSLDYFISSFEFK
ncbi:DUF11 domain-containing protein [Erysipelotrichaceae bacterium OttesenSCG-928-M19]|nr:DUF11 domain-containing protein [Erysipelotrichaceae bacterium OttesenSCG-928-M19]